MGIEYKIKCQPNESIKSFLERLSDSYDNEVIINLEDDGIYFCDTHYGDREIVAKVFYRIVAEVCVWTEEVVISSL